MTAQGHESSGRDSDHELERLRSDNAELRRRVEQAEGAIAELRSEALERRRHVRELAESLPAVVSRTHVVRTMMSEAVHHPDKSGVARRAVRKLGRAPRKALRMLFRRR